ncbi:aryl-alcohol oxidase precursor [Desarmillaria tabescens]|uniref:Aryl-alcohol oxidase n=1 Tax=Armillaria tabescens TaxID=1929756 RepID=A0AA39N7K5_ARMTA|nr:aryl-alcohol oxidase precursor [Desarmillaria tabescens]KAK0460487.1 aryl-alcohol oxidase precursor [Desarmillaria tabescens]
MFLGISFIAMVFLLLFVLALCSSVFGAVYESFDDLPTLDFDFIVIGGGTAGNVVANRLTEDSDISVLVLEAGGSTADELLIQVPFFSPNVSSGTAWDWNFTTTAQSGLLGRSISYPRGFGLGGSSAVNYMLYTRGSSQDYDRYAQISGDPGWGWEALQPYMRKNERFVAPADNHNVSGQFDPTTHGFDGINAVSLPGYPRATDGSIIQATTEFPREFPFTLDFNSGYQLGIGWAQYTIGNGTRSSSQASYLGSAYISRPNLHVLIHARVTRILQSNTKSTSSLPTFNTVEFTQDAGATMHKIAPSSLREIIFSAGSVGTPHILLHSGVGDETELKALGITPTLHLPDVGKNLTDHPMTSVSFLVNSTSTMENIYFRNKTFQAKALAEWKAHRTGFLTGEIANQAGFFRIPVDEGILDGEPSAGNETAHYELAFVNGLFSEPVPETGNYFSITTVVLCPLSRGDVIINSTNPLDPPLINPNYLSHSQDLDVMKYAMASAKKFATASILEDYILEMTTDVTEDDDVRNTVGSIYHPVGTASMSPEDADWGVVDPDLKLKGAKGVRIVDASVLPFIPAAHTEAAVYVIAERAADLIKAE